MPRIAKKYEHMVEEVEDDRINNNGWWIYLKDGYITTTTDCHTIHEDTWKQAYDALKNTITDEDGNEIAKQEKKEIILLDTFEYYDMAKLDHIENATEDGELTKEEAEAEFESEMYIDTEFYYQHEKEGVLEVIDAIINKYNKKYGSYGALYMVGTVQTWQGNHHGGKEIIELENILITNCDDVKVYINEESEIEFSFHHHDGSHHMKLYILSERQKEIFDDGYTNELEIINWLGENRKAQKVSNAMKKELFLV